MSPGFRSRHGIAAFDHVSLRGPGSAPYSGQESFVRTSVSAPTRSTVAPSSGSANGTAGSSSRVCSSVASSARACSGAASSGPRYWKGGTWEGGLWHHGFGPDGAYRPRGAFPGSDVPVLETEEARIDERGPRATVFAASVFGDLPRLWLACLKRALPAGEVRFELFDDSADGSLDGRLLPGVAILPRVAGAAGFSGRVRRRPEARDDAPSRFRRHGRLLALARRLAARSPGIREPARRGRLLCLPHRGGEPRHVRRRDADGRSIATW